MGPIIHANISSDDRHRTKSTTALNAVATVAVRLLHILLHGFMVASAALRQNFSSKVSIDLEQISWYHTFFVWKYSKKNKGYNLTKFCTNCFCCRILEKFLLLLWTFDTQIKVNMTCTILIDTNNGIGKSLKINRIFQILYHYFNKIL